MKIVPVLGLLAAGLALAASPNLAPDPPTGDPAAPAAPTAPPAPDDDAICISCGGDGKYVPPLGEAGFLEQVTRYADEPMAAGSPGLETLLFHHRETARTLAQHPLLALDPVRRAFLQREAARDEVTVALRVIDAEGRERLSTGRRVVPLSRKVHLAARGPDMQAGEFNGTVVRVGLNHLWARY
jgi:hypothetical protein